MQMDLYGAGKKWDAGFFEAVGLGELADENFTRIGQHVVLTGTILGTGLSQKAAQELGLVAGTPLAAGLIDAYSGGGGAEANLAYVFGTPSCTMTSTKEPVFV